jgi:hypothetical protein
MIGADHMITTSPAMLSVGQVSVSHIKRDPSFCTHDAGKRRRGGRCLRRIGELPLHGRAGLSLRESSCLPTGLQFEDKIFQVTHSFSPHRVLRETSRNLIIMIRGQGKNEQIGDRFRIGDSQSLVRGQYGFLNKFLAPKSPRNSG